VSGDLVVYTNNTGETETIHYFDLATSTDHVVPGTGDLDSLPDVKGKAHIRKNLRRSFVALAICSVLGLGRLPDQAEHHRRRRRGRRRSSPVARRR
jgi:hypothetical protein